MALSYPFMQQATTPLLCQLVEQNLPNEFDFLMKKPTSSSQILSLPSSTKCTLVNTSALPRNQEVTMKSSSMKKMTALEKTESEIGQSNLVNGLGWYVYVEPRIKNIKTIRYLIQK